VRSLDHGGCERDAAKVAIGLDRSKFQPHVGVFLTGGYREPEVRKAGVPIVHLPVTSFTNASAITGARTLGRYVAQNKIKLMHAFDVPMDIFGAPASRFYRVPVVITSQLSYRDMYKPRDRAVLRFTDRISDMLVVNSRAVGDSLKRETALSDEKIFLSYNGVDPSAFYPAPVSRPRYLENASIVVGSVCVMRPEKRMDWVIRAFAKVHEVEPDAHLLLVGSGPEVPHLLELRDSLGLRDVCTFEPGEPHVADWMRRMDIYINSSYSESFPNALLEAMACGCCVIGSNVGGIPELITHLEDGLVFESKDQTDLTEKLILAVKNADLRQKMRSQAVRTAHERFSMAIALERTERLYESLLIKRKVQRIAG
jgi:L-malate glycosyltransferase